MNHTTLVILAALTAASLVAGVFAISTQAAFADSVRTKLSNKQKAKCLAIVIDPVNCNNIGANIFANIPSTIVTPPSTLGCPSGTVYDVQTQQSTTVDSTTVPAGSEICLTKPGQNQDATIVIPGDGTIVSDVRIDQSDASGGCPAGGVRAVVNSGNPPNPFDMGETVCATPN